MFNQKLFRYKEFCLPFVVYRAGELTRDDLLEIILELKDIQNEQHDALIDQLDNDDFLQENHERLSLALEEVIAHFDEAIEIALQGLRGPVDEEDDHFEDAMETFKKGNIILADAFYDMDEMWERTAADGML